MYITIIPRQTQCYRWVLSIFIFCFFIKSFAVVRICWAKWEDDKKQFFLQMLRFCNYPSDELTEYFDQLLWRQYSHQVWHLIQKKYLKGYSLAQDPQTLPSISLFPFFSLYMYIYIYSPGTPKNKKWKQINWRLNTFSLMDSLVIVSAKILLLIVITANHVLQFSSTLEHRLTYISDVFTCACTDSEIKKSGESYNLRRKVPSSRLKQRQVQSEIHWAGQHWGDLIFIAWHWGQSH